MKKAGGARCRARGERGVAVGIAENVCAGIRSLLDAPASAVLVDATLLRLPAAEQAKLFEAVAPGGDPGAGCIHSPGRCILTV